jgi:uncharacterized protein YecE (DUF72 family)
MDYGKVPVDQLTLIDFTLPPEPAANKKILSGKKAKDPKVYVGCAKWGRKEWIGKIYPKGTKEADFLEHYLHHYNSIELNATHYQTYPPATIQKWADKANDKEFLFCPKVSQSISHYSTFVNIDDKTNAFLEGVLAFGKHLGPIFLQVSDRFSPKRKENLYKYLESLPTDLQFFLEVRNPDWFSDEAEVKELLATLTRLNIGYIITDVAGRRDGVHMNLTVPKTFIRYVGNSLHPSDYTRIDEWVEHIKYWLDNGMQEVYFFMHMHDEAYSPELSIYLIDKLNTVCGLSLHKPEFVKEEVKPAARKTKAPTKSNPGLFD